MALSCHVRSRAMAAALPKSIDDANLRAPEEYCDGEETAVTYKLAPQGCASGELTSASPALTLG
jgi:hypothetical protein